MEQLTVWISQNLGGLIKDLLLTTISVIVGYRLSVCWSRREAAERSRAEKEALCRNIAFFVNDCRMAMRDARSNIALRLPPYRSIPCNGIEHFQEHLMLFEEHELFVAISTLRAAVEQVNFVMPSMAQQFLASRTDAQAADRHLAILSACSEEMLKRFADIEQHCERLGAMLEQKLAALKRTS